MKITRVLIIEDDDRLSAMIAAFLQTNACECTIAGDAKAGLACLRQGEFDVVLLDLMLPDADGLDVCRALRQLDDSKALVPVVMITARGELSDKIIGLELGADDYLPKPFEPRELLARIRAVLRRTYMSQQASGKQILSFGGLEIDVDARRIFLNGELRLLTGLQFELLLYLARNAGRVLSREQLRRGIGKEHSEAFDRSIDVHIGKIRSAIELDPRFPERILTLRNVGYVFTKQSEKY